MANADYPKFKKVKVINPKTKQEVEVRYYTKQVLGKDFDTVFHITDVLRAYDMPTDTPLHAMAMTDDLTPMFDGEFSVLCMTTNGVMLIEQQTLTKLLTEHRKTKTLFWHDHYCLDIIAERIMHKHEIEENELNDQIQGPLDDLFDKAQALNYQRMEALRSLMRLDMTGLSTDQTAGIIKARTVLLRDWEDIADEIDRLNTERLPGDADPQDEED